MKVRLWLKAGMVLGSLGLSVATASFADVYHYNNILIGERASGLGGAYAAIADDASAVFYNPAGLAFALSNDISGSANALYTKKVTYKKTIGKADFTENSGGTLAPFFGALGKLDDVSPGLVFAFGIYTTDSELKDQNDLINTLSDTEAKGLRLHRTSNVRASTQNYALAIAKRFGSKTALGFGVSYLSIDELVQEYQDVTSWVANDEGTAVFRQFLQQNMRRYLTVTGLEPSLGMQMALGSKFSLGVVAKKGFIVYQKYESYIEKTVEYQNTEGKVVDRTDTGKDTAQAFRAVGGNSDDNALALPAEVRVGLAWFASSSLLLSSDVSYHSQAKGDNSLYDRDEVTNFGAGLEWYTTPSWPIRFGLFTNNDARPEPKKGDTDQPDHVDYNGASLFLAMVQPNSQIAAGVIHQIGKGKAQKIAGSETIQNVEAVSDVLGVSVSHNF